MKKLLTLFLLGLVSIAQAAEPIKIGWHNLQGTVAPYEDPFKKLTSDQIYYLSIYSRISEMQKENPDRVSAALAKEAESAKEALISEKIDIDYMLEQRYVIMEKRMAAALATNDSLANQQIQMAGYMLALEFDEDKVKEFLLVPTIGACAHEAVPNPNQMILVNAQKAIVSTSTYMPVKITGKLQINQQSKELYLIDGSKEVDMSYSMDNAAVEPYL